MADYVRGPARERRRSELNVAYALEKHLAIFVARPAAFDWPWIVWYSRTYLGKNPFGFRVVCALSWDLAKGRKFDVKLPGGAAKGAEAQLVHHMKSDLAAAGLDQSELN